LKLSPIAGRFPLDITLCVALLICSTMDIKNDSLVTEAILVQDGSSSTSVDNVESQGFDEKATKSLIRKLDWHLIPFLSLIYL
jgi:hypothetical protein